MKWIVKRLAEPSTWAALSAATGALSVHLESGAGLTAAVTAAVLGVIMGEKGRR